MKNGRTLKNIMAGILAFVCAFGIVGCQPQAEAPYTPIILTNVEGKAKNVILLIGDGMGKEYV